MAKQHSKISKAQRLTNAVDEARVRIGSPEPIRERFKIQPTREVDGFQREIRFSNGTSALRGAVADARKKAESEAIPYRLSIRPREIPPKIEAPKKQRLVMKAEAQTIAIVPGAASPPRAQGSREIVSVLDLGELLHRVRKQCELTQGDLANAAGTGRRFISDLERGKPTVEFESVLKVCRVLGVDLFARLKTDDS